MGPVYAFMSLGMDQAIVAPVLGATILVSGLLGGFFGGVVVDVWTSTEEGELADDPTSMTPHRMRRSNTAARITFLFACLYIPGGLIVGWTTNPAIFFILVFSCFAFLSATLAPVNVSLLAACAPPHRALVFGVVFFTIHGLGDLISKPLTGWVA